MTPTYVHENVIMELQQTFAAWCFLFSFGLSACLWNIFLKNYWTNFSLVRASRLTQGRNDSILEKGHIGKDVCFGLVIKDRRKHQRSYNS